jgi:hypothetical protein
MYFFKEILDLPLPDQLSSFVEDMDEIAARDKSI